MPSAATWISLETMILIKSERKRQMNGITYMCNLKNDTNKLIYKRKTDLERIYGYQWGRDRLGIWDGHVYTAIFKIGNQQ